MSVSSKIETHRPIEIEKIASPSLVACSEKSTYSINSANSSIGGNSTATLSNEPSSLPAFDDFSSDIFHDLELSSSAVYGNDSFVFYVSWLSGGGGFISCMIIVASWRISAGSS